MSLDYSVSGKQYQKLKEERDRLLMIVDLVAIGTTYNEFKTLYSEYKAGTSADEFTLLEDRLKKAYAEGYEAGLRRGEELTLDRDTK